MEIWVAFDPVVEAGLVNSADIIEQLRLISSLGMISF